VLNEDQMQAIQALFPPEAPSADTSRGFELTSIKAAFVIERLNQVLGPCGIGWRYVHSPFEEIRTDNGRTEIITEVAMQYRYHATNNCVGCDRIVWDTQANAWAFRNSNHDWSEPIFAAGGKSVGKGGAAYTDARKSAVTDGLTKAASMFGIGADVFKGLVRVGRDKTNRGVYAGGHASPNQSTLGAQTPGPTASSGRTQSTASSAGPAHVLTASVRNELSGEICNTWVIHTLWWEPSQTVWREYLKVVTDTGMPCVIFHDLLRDGWFLARIYD
jgi:hypothetical protein